MIALFKNDGCVSVALVTLAFAAQLASGSELAESSPQNPVLKTEILDLSHPFSSDARVVPQFNRSAIGWPFFQTGSIYGIFYRIDPDGFALFSSSETFDDKTWSANCEQSGVCRIRSEDIHFTIHPKNGLQQFEAHIASYGSVFEDFSELFTEFKRGCDHCLLLHRKKLHKSGGHMEVASKKMLVVMIYGAWIAHEQSSEALPLGWLDE